jgi:peptidoglycan hydrolase-like protein with peptidoglycan-binding domain
LEAALKNLRTQESRFTPDNLNPGSNRTAIMDAQRVLKGLNLYQGPIDGIWAGGTAAAVEAFLAQNRQGQERIEAQLDPIRTEVSGAQATLNRLEREDRVRSVERDMPWWARWVRDHGALAGLGTGAVITGGVRQLTRRGVERIRERAVESGNRALTQGTADEAGRAANLNAFYTRGGGPAPFQVDRTNPPLGFTASPRQMVDASGLYPVGNSWFQAPDYARTLGFAGAFGLAWDRREAMRRELEEARRVVESTQTPTRDQLLRVREAQTNYATADLAYQTARGGLLYPATSGVMRYRATATPQTNIAEAEVIRLNNLLAAQAAGNRLPWQRPQARDITPAVRPDPSMPSGYRRVNGQSASREEIELMRLMEMQRTQRRQP